MPVHHREMTVAALGAGAHVLCEKPMAMDAIEGREMVDAADAAGRLLTIGFNLRYTRSARRPQAIRRLRSLRERRVHPGLDEVLADPVVGTALPP